ncbi:MAG: hypothetical protein Fur0041_17310 [Bacteroidia bacterium]
MLLSVILISGLTENIHAQPVVSAVVPAPPRFRKSVLIGASYTWSVINNRKEIRGQYKPGFNAGLTLNMKPWFAITADYTYHFVHASSPSLDNIRSWNADINGNMIMQIGESDLYFRAIFGLSYLNWKGTFVGPSLNDNNKYYVGLVIPQEWVAFNLGCGVSHYVYKSITGFSDFKMRFTSEKGDLLSISDTAFSLGLRYRIPGKSVKSSDNKPKSGRGRNKGGPGYQYKWLKKRK